MAKGDAEVQYPSSSLVKYLGVAAAAVGIVSVVLDMLMPVAQQLGKRKQAKAGLERAITLSVALTMVRTVPRLAMQVRKLRAQLSTEIAA